MEELNDKINVNENKRKIDENAPYKFSNLKNTENKESETNIDFILDLPLDITVELGHTKMKISDLLKLGQGSIIELGKEAGTSFDILANKKLIAKGEVVIVNEKYGIRLTEVINPFERVESLR
jgi:flagellar motor switch protein FliN/FliY